MSDLEQTKKPTLLELSKENELPALKEDIDEGDSGKPRSCCRFCCRIIVCVLCMPFIIVLSLVGILLKIILCPLKACSPCCAPCCQCLVDVAESILMAPFKLFMWATFRVTSDDDEELGLVGD